MVMNIPNLVTLAYYIYICIDTCETTGCVNQMTIFEINQSRVVEVGYCICHVAQHFEQLKDFKKTICER